MTRVVQTLIGNVLNDEGIEFLSINGRTKDKKATLEKINRKSYSDPERQLTDLTGIRVITYLDHQVRAISDIRETFEVDAENSMDRSQILGSDKVGYRSVHFVCSLGSDRKNIREYKDLCDLKFEIQIRTVLQHAWAELTHDRSYKFSGVLPTALHRKLNLHAGILEIVDAAFDEIALSVDSYAKNLHDDSGTELLQEELNSISIKEFVQQLQKRSGLIFDNVVIDSDLINELEKFGVSRISDLERMVTDDIVGFYKKESTVISGVGFLRTVMFYNDPERYLQIAPPWKELPRNYFNLLKSKYGEEKITALLKIHNKTVIDV